MEAATKTVWTVDPTHNEVQFKVRHLVISTVSGSFKKFDGKLISESDDFDGAKASFTVDTESVDTNVSDRDNHLKSDDFFASEKYPQMKFENGVLNKKTDEQYILKGDLTIRDTTKPVELNVEFGGIMKDPYGNTKAGFEISGKVNRKEFGLKWDQLTEAGGVVVGDDVKLNLNVQMVKQS